MKLTIEIKNLDTIRDIFGFIPGKLRDEFKEEMLTAFLLMKPDLQEYPPERPGQRYQRTDKLLEGWSNPGVSWAGSNGLAIQGKFSNNVAYASYVQGNSEAGFSQAWMHKGRWKTADSILKENEIRFEVGLEDAAQKFLDETLGKS